MILPAAPTFSKGGLDVTWLHYFLLIPKPVKCFRHTLLTNCTRNTEPWDALRTKHREISDRQDKDSLLDLKIIFRARKYRRGIINELGKNDDRF